MTKAAKEPEDDDEMEVAPAFQNNIVVKELDEVAEEDSEDYEESHRTDTCNTRDIVHSETVASNLSVPSLGFKESVSLNGDEELLDINARGTKEINPGDPNIPMPKNNFMSRNLGLR